MTLGAIETSYSGRLFRSRLEARWAVFYDALRIPWVYEPEGFALGAGLAYLPDFYLPHLNCYIEIKPEAPSDHERDKAARLTVLTSRTVFIFFGQPGHHFNGGYPSGQSDSDSAWKIDVYDGHGCEDYSYAWCVCQDCGKFGIEFDGRSDRICRHNRLEDRGENPDDPRLLRAYDAANRARFAEYVAP